MQRGRVAGELTTLNAYVLLDRDGTLVEDPGYVHRLEDYALRPRTREGLLALQEAGFRFAILTNQSGIGRGYYTRSAFDRFQQHLLAELEHAGIAIDGTFLCPHAPDAGCACRKPLPGLVDQARAALEIDLENSWIIGDSDVDIGLAHSVGCPSIRIRSARPPGPRAPIATHLAHDLEEAARFILTHPAPAG